MSELHATPETWPEVLAAARPGDTVILAPGQYPSIEVPAGVRIQGTGISIRFEEG